ncbi:MAG TPA: hypothetical protein VLF20_03550 [Patescibacteria group bacterium]|nr:hypothetical protein [Patescibacteria group bacterium]
MASFRGERSQGQGNLTEAQRVLHIGAVSSLDIALQCVNKAEWWMRISDTRRRFPQFVKDFADGRASIHIRRTNVMTSIATGFIRGLEQSLART